MSGDGGNNSRMRSVLKWYLFLSRHLKKLTNSYDIEYRDYESAQAITHFDRFRYTSIQEFQTRASLIIMEKSNNSRSITQKPEISGYTFFFASRKF